MGNTIDSSSRSREYGQCSLEDDNRDPTCHAPDNSTRASASGDGPSARQSSADAFERIPLEQLACYQAPSFPATILSSASGAADEGGADRPAEHNARVSSYVGFAPTADAGVASSGDTVYLDVAAVAGRDARSGIEIEAFSGGVSAGAQNEAVARMARFGISSDDESNSAHVTVLAAEAGVGTHNVDGSVGVNVGASADIISGQATVSDSGNSLTLGLSAGVGGGFSAGIRDQDHDGRPEVCARVSVDPVIIGLCLEDPIGGP